MNNRGFSLLETLVVIAVIALLTAIISPALQKARHNGEDILCKNNLREISRAVMLYAEDQASYPPGFVTGPLPNQIGDATKDWQRGWWWFRYLDEFHSDEKNPVDIPQLWCPSRTIRDSMMIPNVLCSNYGINYGICKITAGKDPEFTGDPLKPGHIRSAGSTLLAMDAGYTLTGWKMFARDTSLYPFEFVNRQDSFFAPGFDENGERLINNSQVDDAFKGRHGIQKINAVFLDGHLERKAASAYQPLFDAQGNVTNKSVWAP